LSWSVGESALASKASSRASWLSVSSCCFFAPASERAIAQLALLMRPRPGIEADRGRAFGRQIEAFVDEGGEQLVEFGVRAGGRPGDDGQGGEGGHGEAVPRS
jgi:hypothetical protein